MVFDRFDKLEDIATGLNVVVTAADELRDDPPPELKPETIGALRQALAAAARFVAELEEQREAAVPPA